RLGSIVGGVGAETVAVSTMGSACAAFTKKVAVMVRDAPAASGPRLQGNVAGVQEFVTNISPAGVWSLMVASATADGPLFVTVRVYVMLVPGVVVSGPILAISRSATGVTSTGALTWKGGSPPGAPSGSIVAVLVTVPAVFGAAATWKLTTANWPRAILPAGGARLFTAPPAADGLLPPAPAAP